MVWVTTERNGEKVVGHVDLLELVQPSQISWYASCVALSRTGGVVIAMLHASKVLQLM